MKVRETTTPDGRTRVETINWSKSGTVIRILEEHLKKASEKPANSRTQYRVQMWCLDSAEDRVGEFMGEISSPSGGLPYFLPQKDEVFILEGYGYEVLGKMLCRYG